MRSLRLAPKLYLLLLLPLVGMLLFSGELLLERQSRISELQSLESLAELAVKLSAVVHEAQKERGMTAGFLGSKGSQFVTELPAQRKLLDARVADLQAFLRDFDPTLIDPEYGRDVKAGMEALEKRSEIRSAVDSLSIAAPDAIGFYTKTNGQLLGLIGHMSRLSRNAEVNRLAMAYTYFMQGKERSGIERAVLSNTFARDSFAPGMFVRFITLLAEQGSYLDVFTNHADQAQIEFYHATLKGPAVEAVEQMRGIAKERGSAGQFGVDAPHWFAQKTERINLLKKVEDKLANDLRALVAERLAQSRADFWVYGAVVVAALLLTLGFASWLVRALLGQVRAVDTSISRMAHDSDLTVRVPVQSADELGHMAEALNGMLEKLHASVKRIDETSHRVAATAEELSAVSGETSEAVMRQQTETDKVATAMNQMSATVNEVAQSAARAADAAGSADQETSAGRRVVEDTIDSIDRLVSEVELAAAAIARLESGSREIGGVVDVIQGIAEQTNLLALNAAIEAARAGEQGRGFAVVADEVRTLASRTQQSTQEIQGMIERLQKESAEASHEMEASRSRAQDTVTQAARAGEALQAINRGVTTINDMNAQIASASEEQSAVAEEINRNITAISQVADQTALAAQNTAEAGVDVARAAEDLRHQVGQFKLA